MINFPWFPRVLLTLVACLSGCLTSCETAKKRAYCGLSVNSKALLIPDNPEIHRKLESVVAAQHLQSNLKGKIPKVVIISVSEDLSIVDAITLYSSTGAPDINTAPLVSLFSQGLPAKADFGRRKIVPR